MSEFFQGWRRKIGCMTLVIACIFMAAWLKSLKTAYLFEYPTGDNTWQEWNFYRGTITLWTLNPEVAPCEIVPKSFGWRAIGGGRWFGCSSQAVMRFMEASSDTSEFSQCAHERCQWQCWSIVIPLTLISAGLLLSQPGKRITKQQPHGRLLLQVATNDEMF